MKRKFIFAMVVACLSNWASAGNVWCTGTISNIYIDSAKNVIIKGNWRNEYTRVCTTDGSIGVDTVTCSLWFSLATTSLTNDKPVTLMYDDQNGSFTCQTIPSYANAPGPVYVMLMK